MTLSKKLKELIENGYRITFKPEYEMYAVTVERGIDEYTYLFLPAQFTEEEILDGINYVVERLNR